MIIKMRGDRQADAWGYVCEEDVSGYAIDNGGGWEVRSSGVRAGRETGRAQARAWRVVWDRRGGHDSNPYSTASRHASFGPSLPCCRRLWMVLKHASQAEHECALSRRCWNANGRRGSSSSGGRERERLEECEDCEDCGGGAGEYRGAGSREDVVLTMSSSESASSSAFRLSEDAGDDDTGDDGGARITITMRDGGGTLPVRARTWEHRIVLVEQLCGRLCEPVSPREHPVEARFVGVVVGRRLVCVEVLF